MNIEIDDLERQQVRELLAGHLAQMLTMSPACSVHALDLERLRQPGIRVWTAWEGEHLLGCGALKELTPVHGEIKSMRTADTHRGKGVGRAMLAHLLAVARERGYERVSLETGATPAFLPALRLYESAGFQRCAPFADYREDPHSVYMTRLLD
ncbi:MAG: GNAT family N-acetyltransferase [Pseudomonadota bacterium]